MDNADDVIYTGQGGNDLLSTKRQIGHQKMERGNLALKVGRILLFNCLVCPIDINIANLKLQLTVVSYLTPWGWERQHLCM